MTRTRINQYLTLIAALFTFGLTQNAIAASTMVTDAVGTQELWTFNKNLGVHNLTSKVNQVDGKGVTQTWDTNNNLTSRTDAEGRVTTYTYNATNQKLSMTKASGIPEARTAAYEYVSADIDLVTKTSSPSIYASNSKEVINNYDANLNITAVTINGFDAAGNPVSRATTFVHDQYGKITQIDGPRTDVNDITTLVYYDCNTGAECGQLQQVTNALGHVSTYDSYDGAARLLQSTDTNGVITTYSYHPRGWMLSMTQTPPTGDARITTYAYDNAGQLIQTTSPDGSEQHYVYDAAHDLREISDNLGNKITYLYDAKGNRTHEEVSDINGTLVRSTITNYDIRNFIESINSAGSVTQLLNNAVGNLSAQTDPNQNPSTAHNYDALDRLTTTVDALTNNTNYHYNVADQLIQVQAPNGATTHYEYDDLGNQTKETSPDRGTLLYTHDAAGNVTSITDDRGITRTYQYDALNRLSNVNYPDNSENIAYLYDAGCTNSLGRLCQVTDETGQTDYNYDAWGNITQQSKTELGKTYLTSYQYDAQNRITQMIYPNGRVVNYQRDAIGRISDVTTTVNGSTTNVLTNRSYRADHLNTGHTLGNGLAETRSYDQQGRVTNITLAGQANWNYSYDANGNVTELNKAEEGRLYSYDVLDRLSSDTKSDPAGSVNDYTYQYDANGNRTKRKNRNYKYTPNSNQLIKDGGLVVNRDEVGNALNYFGDRTFTHSQSNRLRTVTKAGTLKATYRYNSNGQRTRKEIPNKNSQLFHYDLAGNIIMRSTQKSNPIDDYIWVDGELIQFTTLKGRTSNGTIRAEKVKTYLTNDHLMTPRLGTDNNQVTTWFWNSDAFNIKRPLNDPDGDGIKVNLLIGFPGQYYDGESGLFYNWNRYYDRQSGRYVTSDPIGILRNYSNPQLHVAIDMGVLEVTGFAGEELNHTYGYVGQNPLVWFDEYGLAKKGGKGSTSIGFYGTVPIFLILLGVIGGQQRACLNVLNGNVTLLINVMTHHHQTAQYKGEIVYV